MKQTLLLLTLALALGGCENTVDNPEWPEYTERLVVRGELTLTATDSAIVECTVKRTLPLWEQYDEKKATVPTAAVRLIDNDGTLDVPLVSPSNARFLQSFKPNGSNAYTLRVSNNGIETSSTIDIVPLNTVFASVRMESLEYGLKVRAAFFADPKLNASYMVQMFYKTVDEQTWEGRASYPYVPGGWSGFDLTRTSGDSLVFHSEVWRNPTKDIQVRLAIIAYSSSYTDYELARGSYYGGDDFFGGSEKNPPFNFSGDGIGFFWYKQEGKWQEYLFER